MNYRRFLILVIAMAVLLTLIAPAIPNAHATENTETQISATAPSVEDSELETLTQMEFEYENLNYIVPILYANNEPLVSNPGYEEQYTEVPHYFQSFFPNVSYGSSNVRSSGCGIASISMVFSYLFDEYVPIEYLAEKYGRFYISGTGSCFSLFTQSAEDFGIEIEKIVWNWKDARKALEDGHVLIARCLAPSIFTKAGHYMVLAGLTDEGKVIVRDPNLYNFSIWNLEVRAEGYANGFNDENLKYSCYPFWVYPKKDIEAIAARIEAGIPLIPE